RETFRQARIQIGKAWAKERIARYVAERSSRRTIPRSAGATIGVQFRGGDGGGSAPRSARSGGSNREPGCGSRIRQSSISNQIRPARAGVLVSSAISIRRRKWKSGFPGQNTGELPTSSQRSQATGRIAQETLALSERQFIDVAPIEDLGAKSVF